MTVLLVLGMFGLFLTIDWFRSVKPRETEYIAPGYEWLGALAQDGGEKVKDGSTRSKG